MLMIDRYFIFFVCIFYCFLTFPWLNKGLSSLDANGVIHSANTLISNGHYVPSRPPGHPSYEFYLLYPVGKIVGSFFNSKLLITSTIYNTFQFLFGIGVLLSFYQLLRLLGLNKINSSWGVLSFCLSPIFLINSFDGDEVNQALLCFLLSFACFIQALNKFNQPFKKWILIASALLAIATGFRQEFIFTFILFPIFFYLHPNCTFWHFLKYVPVQLIFGFIIWCPVLFYNNFSLPLPMPILENDPLSDLKNKLLAGTYRLVFQGFTLPISILFTMVGFVLYKKFKDFAELDICQKFTLLVTGVIIPMYLVLYYTYPFKVIFVIITLPLVIISCFYLIKSRILTIFLLVFGFISIFYNIEVTKNREVVLPYIDASIYSKAVANKSFFKSRKLDENLIYDFPNEAIVIFDLWPWDLNFMVNENIIENSSDKFLYSYKDDSKALFIANRQILDESDLLLKHQMDGKLIFIKKELFSSYFYRYSPGNVTSNIMNIGELQFHLFP